MHRGWNRFYIQAGLEHDFGDSGRLALLPRWWKRIVEGTLTNDDNPDITQYLGHGDIEARYYYGHGVFSAVAMIHSLQCEWFVSYCPFVMQFGGERQLTGTFLSDRSWHHSTYRSC